MHKITASRKAIRLYHSNGDKYNESFIIAKVIQFTITIVPSLSAKTHLREQIAHPRCLLMDE